MLFTPSNCRSWNNFVEIQFLLFTSNVCHSASISCCQPFHKTHNFTAHFGPPLSFTHTHTRTQTHTHAHTHTVSLSLSLSLSRCTLCLLVVVWTIFPTVFSSTQKSLPLTHTHTNTLTLSLSLSHCPSLFLSPPPPSFQFQSVFCVQQNGLLKY